jgi:CHAT domain-containing protein
MLTNLRTRGDRARHLEKAIEAARSAQSVYTGQACPPLWAIAENNLAGAYVKRIRGERADNIERAIAAGEGALGVLNRSEFADEWAEGQNNLAIAYANRLEGKRADNLECALTACQAALTVRTREIAPVPWAMTQINLAAIYCERVEGDRADNVEKSLAASQSALSVLLAETLPELWAEAMNNLAAAFRVRVGGTREDNVQHAIDAWEEILAATDREAHAERWAELHNSLGVAHLDLPGDRAQNRKRATSAWESALSVLTLHAFPRAQLRTNNLLGHARLEEREFHKADEAFTASRAAFTLLFGQGLNEADGQYLLQIAGSLFAGAAFAAVELGDCVRALSILEEGKARLLSVALRLDDLPLDENDRSRLNGIRLEIREREAAHRQAAGSERTEVLNALQRLRQSLSDVLTSASGLLTPERNDILARLTEAIPPTGAVIVPVLTDEGGKLIVATARDGAMQVTAMDAPEMTSRRLETLMTGEAGWTSRYPLASLPIVEQRRRLARFENSVGEVGSALWGLLGDPLAEALAALPEEAPLIVLPQGSLGLLPVALTESQETGTRIMDKHAVAYAPSLDALARAGARRREPSGAASVAAIVNPTGDLLFSGMEAGLVTTHFSADHREIIAEAAATPDAVLAALNGRHYWHFACHGFFNWDDARKSGLLLAGKEPLTVDNLMSVHDLGAPRLVVLSACETGLYDTATTADEFVGLPTALMRLGACGVISTLWPVDDLSTAYLMARFYDLHRERATSPLSALREAQIWVRDATVDELRDYALRAVERGHLSADLANACKDALRRVEARIDRNDDGQKDRGRSPKKEPEENASQDNSGAGWKRPFAHPYYWAGFILTGL